MLQHAPDQHRRPGEGGDDSAGTRLGKQAGACEAVGSGIIVRAGSCNVSNFNPLLVSTTGSLPRSNLSSDLQSQILGLARVFAIKAHFSSSKKGLGPLRFVNSPPCKMKPQCWPIPYAGRILCSLLRYNLPGVSLRGRKPKKDVYQSKYSLRHKPEQFRTPSLHAHYEQSF